ncbi:unnamed protein product [Prunus armeniaca]
MIGNLDLRMFWTYRCLKTEGATRLLSEELLRQLFDLAQLHLRTNDHVVRELDRLQRTGQGDGIGRLLVIFGSEDSPSWLGLPSAFWGQFGIQVDSEGPFTGRSGGSSFCSDASAGRRAGRCRSGLCRFSIEFAKAVGQGLVLGVYRCRTLRLGLLLLPLEAHHETALGGLVHPFSLGSPPFFRHWEKKDRWARIKLAVKRNCGYTLSSAGTFLLTLSTC